MWKKTIDNKMAVVQRKLDYITKTFIIGLKLSHDGFANLLGLLRSDLFPGFANENQFLT